LSLFEYCFSVQECDAIGDAISIAVDKIKNFVVIDLFNVVIAQYLF